jgi:hypothetical protein
MARDRQNKKLTELKTIPFQGGMNTYNEPGMLPPGTFSMVQNMRQMRPGFKQRLGMIKKHSTADGTNKVLSMFNFSKGKRTERHFYAQMSSDDILEATDMPPAVTTGAFGSVVFAGSSNSIPATWSILNDTVVFSNGVDQHQICAGTQNYIDHFAVYDSDVKLPDMPSIGYDYTDKVSDASATTVAVLDGLGNFVSTTGTVVCTISGTNFDGTNTLFLTQLTVGQPVYANGAEKNVIASITSNTVATVTTAWAATHTGVSFTTSNDCLLICSKVMPNRNTFTVPAVNGNASVACVSYHSTSGWKTLTITDGTIATTGKTMSGTGAITWTQPTDAIPKFMYEKNGFWVKIAFNAALDTEVEVSHVTYGSGFTSIQDVWDGVLVDAIEAQLYISPSYYIYGTSSIDLSAITASAEVYFNSPDPIVAAYIDVGGSPNTTASTTIDHFEYLNPAGVWTTVGTYSDGTSGLSKTGYVTFLRQTDICPMQFNDIKYASYWYRFGVDKTLSATVNIGIQVIPYYDISYFGIGLCNATWKDKSVLVFDQDPSWMYISVSGNSQMLSSSAASIFQAGDGRSNKIVCMKPFYNELLIAQEEKGSLGGCITLLQGTDTSNMGKIILSNHYGAMNSQAMEVVELIQGEAAAGSSTRGGHNAFFLSRNGILFTDGRTINFVKDFEKIRNYFDPSSSTCIHTGYESNMYLKYDSSYHVLKIGLTTGTATVNNVFLVYDILTSSFTADSYANALSCECECEAASGEVPVIQLGGGQADGTIYILNSGTNDVSTAVDSYATIELNFTGSIIRDSEMIIRAKTQTIGDMTVTPYYNGVIKSEMEKTLSLKVEKTSDRIRRHKIPLNFKDQNVSVKIRHNKASESFYLLDFAVDIEEYSEQ